MLAIFTCSFSRSRSLHKYNKCGMCHLRGGMEVEQHRVGLMCVRNAKCVYDLWHVFCQINQMQSTVSAGITKLIKHVAIARGVFFPVLSCPFLSCSLFQMFSTCPPQGGSYNENSISSAIDPIRNKCNALTRNHELLYMFLLKNRITYYRTGYVYTFQYILLRYMF